MCHVYYSLNFSPAVILPGPSLQETVPLECQTGLATITSSSAAPAFPPSIPHSSPPSLSRCLCSAYKHRRSVRKAGSEAHSLASLPLPPPLLLSTLQHALLSLLPCLLSSSTLHTTFPCPPLLSLATSPSLPRCSPYPLYFHPSAPPSSHSPFFFFFWFIICNMILPSPVHAA